MFSFLTNPVCQYHRKDGNYLVKRWLKEKNVYQPDQHLDHIHYKYFCKLLNGNIFIQVICFDQTQRNFNGFVRTQNGSQFLRTIHKLVAI